MPRAMKPWYETVTHYFHATYCDARTVSCRLPEGVLQMAPPNANCCRKVKKSWAELPPEYQKFVRGLDKLSVKMRSVD